MQAVIRSENSALRGLQPTMRFARGGFLENAAISVNDNVAETSKETLRRIDCGHAETTSTVIQR